MCLKNDRFIVCGKFDSVSAWGQQEREQKIVKVYRDRMCNKIISEAVLSVSVENNEICFNGKICHVDDVVKELLDKEIFNVLVLTQKECFHIAEELGVFGIQVYSLEAKLSFIKGIKYSPSAVNNYNAIFELREKLISLGLNPSAFSKDLAFKFQRYIARKIPLKTKYDREFFFAYKEPYQEVFKLKEERPDRVVVALDFNSMYIDSMRGGFCDPETVKYFDFRGSDIDINKLREGVYLVRLIGAKRGFIQKYHPFRFKRMSHAYYFKLSEGGSIETLLFKSEIEYFSKFFDAIEVVEGLCSIKSIQHPLLKNGLRKYKERLYHRSRGDVLKEGLCKVEMQHMHSATNQRRYASKLFSDMASLRSFLSSKFHMDTLKADNESLAKMLIRNKYFGLKDAGGKLKLTYINTGYSGNVFSLSAQTIANARLKMTKTIEQLLKQPSVEICYANVDSIHLSIRRDLLSSFLEKNKEIISDEVGGLKIEAIADRGYWFDLGRYWLFQDKNVILFRNRMLHREYDKSPFVFSRKIKNTIRNPNFIHTQSSVIRIDNDLSYNKRLSIESPLSYNLDRYDICEVSEVHKANLTEANERLASANKKRLLLKEISK